MFKPGEIVICVNKLPYNYAEYYNHKYNVRFKKSTTGPKTITIGNTYEIISCDKNLVFIKNDKGKVKSFRKDRFVDKIYARRIKIEKLSKDIRSLTLD